MKQKEISEMQDEAFLAGEKFSNEKLKEILKYYISLYEGDKPFLKSKIEKDMNKRSIEEFKSILKSLK